MYISLLSIVTGIIGLTTALLIFKNYAVNRIMNPYIIILILIISLRFLFSGLTYFIFDPSFKITFSKYSNASIIVIPLCYLYFKNLAENKNKIYLKDLLHFIFPLSLLLLINNQDQIDFGNNILEIVLYILFFIFSITYIFLCFHLLKTKIWSRKGEIKVLQKQNKLINNWTLFLFVGLILALIRLFLSVCLEIYTNESIKGFSYQWISALIWAVILFKILISPEILFGYNLLHQKFNENKNNNLVLKDIWKINSDIELKNSQHLILKEKIDLNIMAYITQIESVALQFELFRNADLSITDLSTNLKIPKSHISYLFKYHSFLSFSEFKKLIRIHDAIHLIELNFLNKNTLESLSKKVGFTSYNPFFTSFKEIAGMPPLEYYKLHKKELEA